MSSSLRLKRKIIHSENEDTTITHSITHSITHIMCNSKNCDHQNKRIKMDIHHINTLKDLIELGKKYNCITNREYNGINLRVINNLIEPLSTLDNMIGLQEVKNKIIDNCLYIARGYNSIKCNSCIDCKLNISCVSNSKEMLHTVITGPPGVGKTELARILTKIYSKIGIIKNDKIIEVSRKDLVAGYLGKTAMKTQKVFDSAKNSVLFIDEAYSLGNTGDMDSYSKECIDVINKNLSENRNTIVIIAGYKEQIEECFFRVNPGLKRRFPFVYNVDGYSGGELFDILKLKIINDKWILEKDDEQKIKKYINNNVKNFPNYGGDMETILMKAKIKNSRNINAKNYVLRYDDFILE